MTEPPVPEEVAPDDVPEPVRADIEAALRERHANRLRAGESLQLAARHGSGAAWVRARVGDDAAAWEMELCATDIGGVLLDGALAVLVDWLDGALEEWFENDRDGWVSVAWSAREYGDDVVWVRGETRDFEAEHLADEWLKRS